MQPALHAGQVMQRSTLRGYVLLLELSGQCTYTPVCKYIYGRLCLAVRNTFSPKFNLTSQLYVSNTVSLGLTAYLIQQEVKNDKMYI